MILDFLKVLEGFYSWEYSKFYRETMRKFIGGELNALDFELLLEVYQNEVEELETGELCENDLSFTQDSILEGVKRALERINKYFTD